ncbi:MAG: hypothetical protein R3224_09795 [Balneolaceae bacterium]|nr:hypothetical protein [Balneolaceae bacterium]
MSNDKSLGSSPIGYSSLGSKSFKFIRDLGVSSETETAAVYGGSEKPQKGSDTDSGTDTDTDSKADMDKTPARKYSTFYSNRSSDRDQPIESKEPEPSKQSEKKIVSYYLDKDLISRLKALANDQNTYYSSVVSSALEFWVKKHGY